MDQPPALAFTAFADAWPRAIETEIGAALCAIGRGKELVLTFFNYEASFQKISGQPWWICVTGTPEYIEGAY